MQKGGERAILQVHRPFGLCRSATVLLSQNRPRYRRFIIGGLLGKSKKNR